MQNPHDGREPDFEERVDAHEALRRWLDRRIEAEVAEAERRERSRPEWFRRAILSPTRCSVEAAAHRIGVDRRTIYRWLNAGILPTAGRGRPARLWWGDVEAVARHRERRQELIEQLEALGEFPELPSRSRPLRAA